MTDTLTKMHKQTTLVSINLESRKVSPQIIEKCNAEYVRLVKSGDIGKPFNYTENVDVQTASKIIKKTLKKVRSPLDKRVLAALGQVSEIMEKHRIGLLPYLDKDEDYQELSSKLTEQRARVDKKTTRLIAIYLDCSYGLNNLALLYIYMSKIVFKGMKDKPPEFNYSVPSFRKNVDKFMSILLAEIEEEIGKSVSGDD